MRQNEVQEVVATGELHGFRFRTERRDREVLHRITVTGPIDLQRRIPLYEATLAVNPSPNYFCIVDNRAGFENAFSFADIRFLAEVLKDGGISHLYAVTITDDQEYGKIVELANITVTISSLQGELLSTNDAAEAEMFIQDRLAIFTARQTP